MSKLFSVVVPTYNRCSILQKTLAALFEQTLEPALFEVIVIDDGSTDGTAQLLRSLVDSAPVSLTYEQQENSGPAAARNRAIELAQGEHLLFIDDDIVAEHTLLQEHLRCHRLHPALNEAVLGNVIPAPWIPDTYRTRYWVSRWGEIADRDVVDWSYFATGNISLKRRFLLDEGLFFDEQLRRYSDPELGYRAAQRGLRIFYNRRAIGYHDANPDLEQSIVRAYNGGRALAVLHRKNPALKSHLGDSLVFSWHSSPGRIMKDLTKLLVRNQFTMPLFRFLVRASEGRYPNLASFCAHQISAYYERVGYQQGWVDSAHQEDRLSDD